MKLYVSKIILDGTTFKPECALSMPGAKWSAVDGRGDSTALGGVMFVQAYPANDQHSVILSLPDTVHLDVSEDLNDSLPKNITDIKSYLEGLHIPMQGSESLTVRELAQTITRRFLIRQILGADDFTEDLTSNYSLIGQSKRNTINTKLNNLGLTVPRSGTIRSFLKSQGNQNSKWMRTHYDN